jgi:ribosomal protein S18 acetylase RimI-like enzyme
MAISIRIVEPGDTSWFERIADDVFDYPLYAPTLERYLETPLHFLLIATDGDLVVGQLSAVIHHHPDQRPTELYVDEVGVSPSYQRQGIAKRLIEAAFTEGRRRGCREAWLGTEPDNLPANALYAPRAETVENITMYVFEL